MKAQACRSPQSRQFWLAWLCALCLLGFQGVGHWHRIAHAGGLAGLEGQTEKTSSNWGHQSGDAGCHLFDQLGHDQAPTASVGMACAVQSPLQPGATNCPRAFLAACWKRSARGPPISA